MKKLVLILFSLSCSISYCQNSDDDKNLKESLEELNRLELMAKRQFEENGFTATEYSNEIARISRYRKQIIDLDSFYIDSFLGFKFGMSIDDIKLMTNQLSNIKIKSDYFNTRKFSVEANMIKQFRKFDCLKLQLLDNKLVHITVERKVDKASERIIKEELKTICQILEKKFNLIIEVCESVAYIDFRGKNISIYLSYEYNEESSTIIVSCGNNKLERELNKAYEESKLKKSLNDNFKPDEGIDML